MKAQSNDPKLTELAADPPFTVADYESAVNAQERDKIADALHRRFEQRYIDPVSPSKDDQSGKDKESRKQIHGFTMMAISCLLIETLQSFRQGWENTNGNSQLAFCQFFSTNESFKEFRVHSVQFYKNVRCGILHQAETTGGWKITRNTNAPLFNPNPPTINAILFLQELREALNKFREGLKAAEWDSSEWRNVRKKMKALCKNCDPSSTPQ
jgi:hypothetical protein